MVEIFNDKELMCADCKKKFIFEAGEQKFFAIKGFRQPKRCQPCRFNKRNKTQEEKPFVFGKDK